MDDIKSKVNTNNSKLENLTREDLIKFSKKQLIANQKSKKYSEDLNLEIEKLKAQLEQSIVNNVVLKESSTQSDCLDLDDPTQKLVEWEEIMKMNELERDQLKTDLLNLKYEESQTLLCLDEILNCLSTFTKDKDLFFERGDFSDSSIKDSNLLKKCRFLFSIIEDIIFERDEVREKCISLCEEYIVQVNLTHSFNEAMPLVDFTDKIKFIFEASKDIILNLKGNNLQTCGENERLLQEIQNLSSHNLLIIEEMKQVKFNHDILFKENDRFMYENQFLINTIEEYKKNNKTQEKVNSVNGIIDPANLDLNSNICTEEEINCFDKCIDNINLMVTKPKCEYIFADVALEMAFKQFILKLLNLMSNLKDKKIQWFKFINVICLLVKKALLETKVYFEEGISDKAISLSDLQCYCNKLIDSFEKGFKEKEFEKFNLSYESNIIFENTLNVDFYCNRFLNTCDFENLAYKDTNLQMDNTFVLNTTDFSNLNSEDISTLNLNNEVNSKLTNLKTGNEIESLKNIIFDMSQKELKLIKDFIDKKLSNIHSDEDSDDKSVVHDSNNACEEIKMLNSKIQNLKSELMNANLLYVSISKELDSLKIIETTLKNEKILLENKINILEEDIKKIKFGHSIELKQMNEELKNSSHECSMLKKDAQQFQLIKLEISDFERTIIQLNATNKEQIIKINSYEEEIMHYKNENKTNLQLLDTQEKQMKQLDEQINKLKCLLVKNKKELAESKKIELDGIAKISQLVSQVEIASQDNEYLKLELSNATSEILRLNDQIKAYSTACNFNSSATEEKLHNLEQQLTNNNIMHESLKNEYEAYKIRVHNVLKNKKEKPSEMNVSELDNTIKKNEEIIDQLKLKISDLTSVLSIQIKNYELLNEDYISLKQKLANHVQEYEHKYSLQAENYNSEKAMLMEENLRKSQMVEMLQKQIDVINNKHKEALKMLQNEHSNSFTLLKNELIIVQKENEQLTLKLQHSMANLCDLEIKQNNFIVADIYKEERPAAEGSEEEEVKKISIPTKHTTSFEDLLSSNECLNEGTLLHSGNLDSNINDIIEKQISHLRMLLNESESTVLRLTEQACILKDEIRRLERNEHRQNSVSNMEYLKNVVFKFLTLKSGLERNQLIPALNEMLKFSIAEKELLTQIALGGNNFLESSSLWNAYIPKWPKLL